MSLTEETLKELVSSCQEELRASVKKNVRERMAAETAELVRAAVREQVKAFVDEHVVPGLQAHLIEERGALIEGVLKAADGMVAELGKSLVEGFKEKLSRSYDRKRVLEALFA